MNNSPRLQYYSLFKHSFNFESYLDMNIKDKKNKNLKDFEYHDSEIEKETQRDIDVRESFVFREILRMNITFY